MKPRTVEVDYGVEVAVEVKARGSLDFQFKLSLAPRIIGFHLLDPQISVLVVDVVILVVSIGIGISIGLISVLLLLLSLCCCNCCSCCMLLRYCGGVQGSIPRVLSIAPLVALQFMV